MVRVMTIEDYDEVYALWMSIKGFGIRSIDDSKEGIEIFLKRNPTTCCVDVEDGKIVGAILCGHDGRRACMYHVCVPDRPICRRNRICLSRRLYSKVKFRHDQCIKEGREVA